MASGPACCLRLAIQCAGGAWPDAGQTLRAAQGIPTIHYVKAPTYQFSYGIGTVTQADYRLMQRETVALTQMLLDLSRVPYADLRKEQRRSRRGSTPPFPALLPALFHTPYQHTGKQALVWPASPILWGKAATGIVILRKE